jgi:hypothetical protein
MEIGNSLQHWKQYPQTDLYILRSVSGKGVDTFLIGIRTLGKKISMLAGLYQQKFGHREILGMIQCLHQSGRTQSGVGLSPDQPHRNVGLDRAPDW